MYKKLIKEQLSLLVEGPQRSNMYDYLRTKFKMLNLTKQYKGDSYFMGEDQGEFIAAAIVDIRGNVKISQVAKVPAGDLKSNRLGITRDTKDYMQFYIMAGRGIEHPDTIKNARFKAQTLGGVTKTVHLNNPITSNGKQITSVDINLPQAGSPASDAQIKTYLLYGPMILDFVEKNLDQPIGYNDGKAPEIRNASTPKMKITTIRKDAEDKLRDMKLARVDFIQTFEEFRNRFIDTLSPEELQAMDTKAMTSQFIDFYMEKTGAKSKGTTSLSANDADDVISRQAELQKKIAAMRARRGG